MASAGEADAAADVQSFLRVVRTMVDALGRDLQEAVEEVVPEPLREAVLAAAEQDAGEVILRVRGVSQDGGPKAWFADWDPAGGLYWRRQRQYLLDIVGRSPAVLQSLDDDSDRVLAHLEDPRPSGPGAFNTRGLVLGYVQSGKTANISAVIAKAADVGYRVVIVLSGMDNGLRRQTQQRLDRELGLADVGVGRPDPGDRWVCLTDAGLHGDFQPGTTDPNVLQGNEHVILVTKKNARVLDRLIDFVERARVPASLPVLVIDDEADQASINTGGNRPTAEDGLEAPDDDFSDDDLDPSKINAKIRRLINAFQRVAYVGYTATPFANVLINHEAADREVLEDLFPKDFILSLPTKPGYVGTERLFGRAALDGVPEDEREALDVIRLIPGVDAAAVHPVGVRVADFEPYLPPTLETALCDWVLATGGILARAAPHDVPSCLLVHIHQQTRIQNALWGLLNDEITRMRSDWRYDKERLRPGLRDRWETRFRPVTVAIDPGRDRPFEDIEPHIDTLFKHEVPVLALNSRSREALGLDEDHDLDFERDPTFKGVVIGGNRLSRGMTLEGLSVSYYVRETPYYDTLLQMARWFGYRESYVDLTRIWTTETLASWFRDLALREEDLRQQINQAEREGLSPVQVGYIIRSHPAMMVTAQNKMGAGRVDQLSYAGRMIQTSRFRLSDPRWLRDNLQAVRTFVGGLGVPGRDHTGPAGQPAGRRFWRDVPADQICALLADYRTVQDRVSFDADAARRYIVAQNAQGELRRWQVAIVAPDEPDGRLGTEDLGVVDEDAIGLISRTRLKTDSSSIGVLTNPAYKDGATRRGDEEIGLTDQQILDARQQLAEKLYDRIRDALLAQRDVDSGALLVIYPISRHSRPRSSQADTGNRRDLFDDPQTGETVVGLAIAFPPSESAATVEYVAGSVAQQQAQ